MIIFILFLLYLFILITYILSFPFLDRLIASNITNIEIIKNIIILILEFLYSTSALFFFSYSANYIENVVSNLELFCISLVFITLAWFLFLKPGEWIYS